MLWLGLFKAAFVLICLYNALMLLYGDIGLLLADPEFEFLFLFLNRDELIPLLDPFDLIEIFADEKAILFSNWDVFCSRLFICKWSINISKLE